MYQLVFFSAIFSISLADAYLGHLQPYGFGYSIKSPYGEQHKQESGTGGVAVQGSYGFTDNRGLHRHVNYVADHGGFRAQVKTNEPGTVSQDPAAVNVISSAHPYFGSTGLGLTGSGHVLGHTGLEHGLGYTGHVYGFGYQGLGNSLEYGGRGYDHEWEKHAAGNAAAYGLGIGHGHYGYAGYGLGVSHSHYGYDGKRLLGKFGHVF